MLYLCDRKKKCNHSPMCGEECIYTDDPTHEAMIKEVCMIIEGDRVRHTKTGREGTVVHTADGCTFVQFDDSPDGCVQIILSERDIELIQEVEDKNE